MLLEEQKIQISETTPIPFQSQILASKMKSLNNQLNSLLQKRIRINLEIKRTKVALTKIKKKSITEVKTSINLEGSGPLSEEETRKVRESMSSKEYESLLDLDRELDEAEFILEEVEKLEYSGQLET